MADRDVDMDSKNLPPTACADDVAPGMTNHKAVKDTKDPHFKEVYHFFGAARDGCVKCCKWFLEVGVPKVSFPGVAGVDQSKVGTEGKKHI